MEATTTLHNVKNIFFKKKHRKTIALCIFFLSNYSQSQTLQSATRSYQYDADGNLTQITDPLGKVTMQSYDTMGRLTLQSRQAENSTTSRSSIAYTYNPSNQLLTVTDARGLVTIYDPDGLGNQNLVLSPDTKKTEYTYDQAGNIKTRKDARSYVTNYSYDNINRLTLISYDTGVSTKFEYDGGQAPSKKLVGHLTKMTDESGTTTYDYDAYGRLLSKTQNATGTRKAQKLQLEYGTTGNETGKVINMMYPSGNRVVMGYGNDGRITSMDLFSANKSSSSPPTKPIPLLKQISYHRFGTPRSWVWGNGELYLRTFDQDGRQVSFPIGIANEYGIRRTLLYDAAGRISAIYHTSESSDGAALPQLDQRYQYDEMNRLLNVTGNVNQTFNYDASGNRIESIVDATSRTHIVSLNSNQIVSTRELKSTVQSLYDASGNLTSDGTAFYTYSARGRMSIATIGGRQITYRYNGHDQRIIKSGPTELIPSGKQEYVYDQNGRLIGEYDINGDPTTETIYLGDQPLVVIKHLTNGEAKSPVTRDQIFYIYVDQINAPRMIIRSTDNKASWRWDMTDPFGFFPPHENPAGLGVFTYNLRFPGQFYDRETNLHHNFHRDYEPRSGRYLQSDPTGIRGGTNTYVYSFGNPVDYFDPDGFTVRVVANKPDEARKLMLAYAKLNQTARGRAITGPLERSMEVCEIRPISKDAFYCPRGIISEKCELRDNAIFIDPNNLIALPTSKGLEPTPLAVTLGHELGHANGELDDGPNEMNNININENPIRSQLGVPARTGYEVPFFIWTPN